MRRAFDDAGSSECIRGHRSIYNCVSKGPVVSTGCIAEAWLKDQHTYTHPPVHMTAWCLLLSCDAMIALEPKEHIDHCSEGGATQWEDCFEYTRMNSLAVVLNPTEYLKKKNLDRCY